MAGYYRCAHCKGFYETDLESCKYCRYKTVLCGADGKPRLFPDRETCRAIQIAEYEQLPPEAMADCFKPAKDELSSLCGCLHCGQDGPLFEAVEMRWMASEQMWACPCTTCGGRGFDFDIHPIEARWECAECRHKWKPPGGNAKRSNCKCPKCGCTEASGWFDDEYSEDEIEAMSEEEYAEAFGRTREEEERDYREFKEKFEREQRERKEAGLPAIPDEDLPWDDADGANQDAAAPEDFTKYDPEGRTGEVREGEDEPYRPERLPDDIDFPRERERGDGTGPSIRGEDIPF